MNLTLIGSTGHTGRYVLAEALRRGHRVTAFTRNAAALEARPHAVVEGDGRDLEKMRTAVADADAVISIINGGDSRDPHRAAEATRTVMRAMAEARVRRLIVTTPIRSSPAGRSWSCGCCAACWPPSTPTPATWSGP